MRHSKLILLSVMVLCCSMALAQDCKVPTSFLTRVDYDQSHDANRIGRGQNDVVLTRQRREHFVDSCGFSDDMENTRYAICLNSITTSRTVTLRVSLTDAEHNIVIYSAKLDTVYCDEDVAYLFNRMYYDLHIGVIPQYLRILDTIRTEIINLYEINTPTVLKTARKLIAQNDIEQAMFRLAQYPACCPSYPSVKAFILAAFREYVKKDHNVLFNQARQVWNSHENETDARFVVSLLNSEELTKSERKKADKMLSKIAKEYPSIDITAKEDYTGTPELAAVAVRLSYKIGVIYSSMHAPETFNYIPEV